MRLSNKSSSSEFHSEGGGANPIQTLTQDRIDACATKRKYDKKGAQTTRNHQRKLGFQVEIYPCPVCPFWHLTHIRRFDKNWRRRK